MTRSRSLGFAALLAAGLGGCFEASVTAEADALLLSLQDGSQERRDEAFQELLRAAGLPANRLRAALGVGSQFGHPVVALLYAQGRGDAVSLDLRARHLAGFEWPRSSSNENAVVESYVKLQIEQDLVRTGRPALRALGLALEEVATTEEGALRVVRAILWIGGRAAASELAKYLGTDRDLGDSRICDLAAAALLYLGRQELSLRSADPESRVVAARDWWDVAKDFPESEWSREVVEELVGRDRPDDPESIRPVLGLLVGRLIEDPRRWWEEHSDWKPSPAPVNAEDLLPELSLDRCRSYDANRRLEESTGVRMYMPGMRRLSELLSAFRLWQPPPDLETRWRRYLQSPLLRLSVAAIGSSGRPDAPRIRWAYETHFRAIETESGELRIETKAESYELFVHALEWGTHLVAMESHGSGGRWSGVLREFRGGKPMVLISTPLRSAVVAVVEEVAARRVPPSSSEIQAEWRSRLRSWADSDDALRALGYFQDDADRNLLRQHRAGVPLLLLGDPAGLEFQPQLEPHEIEMALRRAEDPRVREYLERLRRK